MPLATSTQTHSPSHSAHGAFQTLKDEISHLRARLASEWDEKWAGCRFRPSCDVSETTDEFLVRLDLPGVQPEEINLQVTGNSVQICGERKEPIEAAPRTYHRRDRRCGEFSETLRLPSAVDEQHVHAELQDGILTVRLPKKQPTRIQTAKVCPVVRRPGSAC